MAKTPNQSSGSTPNTLADVGAQHVPSEITRAIDRLSTESQKYQNLTRRLGAIEDNPTYQHGVDYPAALSNPAFALNFGKLATARSRILDQQDIINESVKQRTSGVMLTAINRTFGSSAINGIVQERLSSLPAQQESIRQASMHTAEGLQARLAVSNRRIKMYGDEASNLAIHDPDSQKRFKELYGLRERELDRRTGIVGAMRVHRTQGSDVQSRYDQMVGDVSKAKNALESDPTNKLANNLVTAFERLSKVVDVTSEDFTKFTKEVEGAQKAFGNGGGGGRSNYDTAMGSLGVARSGFGAMAGAAMQIGVNQRLGQMYNAAGLAGFENQKYQTYKAAMGGDIASLLQLSQFGGAEAFGSELKSAANIAKGAEVAGGLAQVAAGGVDIGASLNPVENTLSTSAAEAGRERGTINVMEGTAAAGTALSDMNRQVSGNQAAIAGRNAVMEVGRAVNAVGAEQLQGFRDFGVGMGTAAIGFGSGGEALLKRTITDANLARMAGARMSPEQMAQMSQMGIANMGSMFNENQVFTARGYEQRGLGTMQENMQRMGALAAAGSNNPTTSLGAITETAVMRGLDSSKALNAVVDHTAAMAASSTGRAFGLDTATGAAALIMGGVGRDVPNKEAEEARVAGLQDVFKNIGTNIGANYTGMTNIARISKTTGLDTVSSLISASIDDQTLVGLGAGSGDFLRQKGINVGKRDVGTLVGQLKEDRQMQLLSSQLVVNFDRNDALKRINKGDSLTSEEEQGLARTAALETIKTGQNITPGDITNHIRAITSGAVQEAYGPAAPAGETFSGLDLQRTAGFQQLSQAASAAATSLGGASTAVGTLTKAIEALSAVAPGIEKSAGTAAAKAAAGLDAKEFNGGIDRLVKAIQDTMGGGRMNPATGTATNKVRNTSANP